MQIFDDYRTDKLIKAAKGSMMSMDLLECLTRGLSKKSLKRVCKNAEQYKRERVKLGDKPNLSQLCHEQETSLNRLRILLRAVYDLHGSEHDKISINNTEICMMIADRIDVNHANIMDKIWQKETHAAFICET